jgi:hypothetical protein
MVMEGDVMRWQYLAGTCGLCAFALAVAFVFRGDNTEAQETRKTISAHQPAAKPASEPRIKASKDQTAAELVAIIQETESPETFLVSLMALVTLDPKDTSILPIAIRKAEKLDLLKGMLGNEQMRPGQEMLMQLFEVMIGDKLEKVINSGNNANKQAPNCLPGNPPVLYGPPANFPPGAPSPAYESAIYSDRPVMPVNSVPAVKVKRVMPPPQPIVPQLN